MYHILPRTVYSISLQIKYITKYCLMLFLLGFIVNNIVTIFNVKKNSKLTVSNYNFSWNRYITILLTTIPNFQNTTIYTCLL